MIGRIGLLGLAVGLVMAAAVAGHRIARPESYLPRTSRLPHPPGTVSRTPLALGAIGIHVAPTPLVERADGQRNPFEFDTPVPPPPPRERPVLSPSPPPIPAAPAPVPRRIDRNAVEVHGFRVKRGVRQAFVSYRGELFVLVGGEKLPDEIMVQGVEGSALVLSLFDGSSPERFPYP